MAGAVERAVDSLIDALTSPKTLRLLLTSFLASSLLLFGLVSSSIASLAFYNILIPPVSSAAPVYLQYGAGIPSAKMALPKALRGSQEYDMLVELQAPASRRNLDLGNFMVSMALLSDSGKVMTSSSRPTSLEEAPLVYSLLSHAFGLRRAQRLRIPLFNRLKPKGASSLELSVGRPGAELHLYKATVIFDACFTGYKYLMHQHRILTFTILASTFFFWELISALVVWSLVFRRAATDSSASLSESDVDSKQSTGAEQQPERSSQTVNEHESNRSDSVRRRRRHTHLDLPFDPEGEDSVLDSMLAKSSSGRTVTHEDSTKTDHRAVESEGAQVRAPPERVKKEQSVADLQAKTLDPQSASAAAKAEEHEQTSLPSDEYAGADEDDFEDT